MLPGFEQHTKSLNKTQVEILVPIFLKGFKGKIGKSNAITSTEIIDKIKCRYNVELSDSTVRKVVNHIRNNNLLPGLIASSEGYYISNNIQDVKRYIDSLSARINEITRIKNGMVEHLKNLTRRSQSNLYQ